MSARRALLLGLALVAFGNVKAWYDLVVLGTTAAGSVFGAAAGLALVAVIVLGWRALGLPLASLGISASAWQRGIGFGLAVGLSTGIAAGALTLAAGLLGLPVAAVTPAARVPWEQLLFRVFVLLWLDTALPEEVAFRGALLATSGGATRAAVVGSSVAFGLWHVVVVQQDGSAEWWVYALKLLVICVGGFVFAWVRIASRQLLGSVVAHWAFDVCAMLAARLAIR